MSDAYSFSLTTFNPSGSLGQIEHALAAVADQPSAVGIKAKNGVVIATEKRAVSSLVDEKTLEKIQVLAPNCGMVYAGMPADYRVLVRRGRKAAQEYYTFYREPTPVSQHVRELAAIMQEFTQSGGVRPFGVSLLMAGYDDSGPQLFQVDPSGTYFGWKATSIGKNSASLKSFLERRYTGEEDIEDAIHTVLLTLKETFEGELTPDTIEIGVIKEGGQFEILSPQRIRDQLNELE